MSILLQAESLVQQSNDPRDRATMDCIWLAFYFLLRPGEYANATGDAKHPFRLQDVQFKVGHQHYSNPVLMPLASIHSATYASLTFTTQKNGVKGEKLAHATNGQAFACPVRAIARRVLHLRSFNAPISSPLHTYFDSQHNRKAVSSAMITSLLRAAALTIPGHCGVDPNNIAARSLRSSGAMSLLLSGVDPDKIRVVGRWNSDAMFRYLHGHALPLVQRNSTLMFQGGHYTLAQ